MNPLVELQARQDEIRARFLEIEEEHADEVLPDDVQTEHDELTREFASNDEKIKHFEERRQRAAVLAADTDRRQSVGLVSPPSKAENVYDLSTMRTNPHSQPEAYGRELRDRAMRAIEAARFGNQKREAAQDRVADLVENYDTEDGWLARRILNTGSPTYVRAFGKKIMGKELSTEEARALSTTAGEGGVAVPFTLDPTIILTSDGSVNPLRQIARVESIVGSNTWQGVTSTGITVTRKAEEAEATDDAPALVQPEVTVQRVDGFIPFSVEIGQDWGALQSEMARLLQEAKDDEEADSFVNGDGTGTNAGGIVGTLAATSLVDVATTGAFAVSDLYALEEALPDRFLARARFMANRAIYNVIRQLDTSGGADLWVRLADGLPPELIGYPAHTSSEQASTFTAADGLLIGDFRHFLIVDRVGMNVELLPHLIGANRRPTGQRGIFAMWRNNSAILADNAFRLLTDDGV